MTDLQNSWQACTNDRDIGVTPGLAPGIAWVLILRIVHGSLDLEAALEV
jgi:hypothetical protein